MNYQKDPFIVIRNCRSKIQEKENEPRRFRLHELDPNTLHNKTYLRRQGCKENIWKNCDVYKHHDEYRRYKDYYRYRTYYRYREQSRQESIEKQKEHERSRNYDRKKYNIKDQKGKQKDFKDYAPKMNQVRKQTVIKGQNKKIVHIVRNQKQYRGKENESNQDENNLKEKGQKQYTKAMSFFQDEGTQNKMNSIPYPSQHYLIDYSSYEYQSL